MNYELEYLKASKPMKSDLKGVFRVKILTGISHIPGSLCEEWKKIIFDSGINEIKWNEKSIEKSGVFMVKEMADCLHLDYDNEYNSSIWRRLKDMVKMVNENLFIGAIYFKFWGKYRFLGYFYLIKRVDYENNY